MKTKSTTKPAAKPASKSRRAAATRPAGPTPATKTADSLEALAKLVGRHVRTLQRHMKSADAPQPDRHGKHDVSAWIKFLALNGKDPEQTRDPEVAALKIRKLAAEVEERELRLAVRRGELVPLSIVRGEWTTLVAQATAVMRAKFESELPPILSGLDATGIQTECQRAVDEVLRCLHQG